VPVANDCPALGYSALVGLSFVAGDQTRRLEIFATHGAGSAATIGGKINRLVRYMRIFPQADLVAMGHVHECVAYRKPHLFRSDLDADEHETLGLITGTYLRTYTVGHSGYGERAGYDPTPIGHPVVTIVPETLALSVGWA
jgi:hypothetical protein